MADKPRWLAEIERLLPIRAQFVLSGNIRDMFLTQLAHMPGNYTLAPLLRCLWESLKQQGFSCMLVYDPIQGIRPYPNESAVVDQAVRLFDLKLSDGAMVTSLESLINLAKKVVFNREARTALILDFASRVVADPGHLSSTEHRFFVAAEHAAVMATPIVPVDSGLKPLFNPLIWLLNRSPDMPSWYSLDNTSVETLTIGSPDFEVREQAAGILIDFFPGHETSSEEVRSKCIKEFARLTEGLRLSEMNDIAVLAGRQKIPLDHIDDAIQCYKVGVLENPWKKAYLRERIADAKGFIEDRVKGQPQAVTKTIDILMRSVMGLTGAQARSSGNRPRGVLFFAGPTGVGKTELAKTLTQLLFGNDSAYIRFDMSEFAEEHSSARLLGAPPGYVGYDAGGQLTNAVREKPFSVVLFDEIEKAHPRILDKFLQILEDGRLTDGRGETAYFSEAVVVFTSNLGIFIEDENGQRIQNVKPGDSYNIVETRVRDAIADYFKYRLSRPEILNRIGDNIVVFDFISSTVGEQIFDGIVKNIVNRVKEEHRVTLHFLPYARNKLLDLCTRDMSNGGRGIGNHLESLFINPLSRAMFARQFEVGDVLTVADIVVDEEQIVSIVLQ